jgi:hypothetical protein
MNKLENLEHKIKVIQNIMIAYATDGRNENQSEEYQNIYIELDLEIEQAGYTNPNPYKTIESFWKNCGNTWAERRDFVKNIYADLLFDIGRKKRIEKDPRNWKKANQKLNDKLSPVRQQWLKAKNFIYISPPDYENSMKEAISSVESTLMILLAKPNGTLGKIIKSAKLDKDIERVISHAYGLLSDKDFVRHGGTQQQEITHLEAEFFLEFSASAIIYITSKLKPDS